MTRKIVCILAVIFILAVMIQHNYSIRPWMLDDAFISFRYAENFTAGHGLVFNPGERVEGYTTFLWVLILAAGKALGLHVIPLSQNLGALFALGTILLLLFAHRFSSRISEWGGLLAALFLGTCGVFTPWPSSGMEVSLFTFLVLISLLYHFSLAEKEFPTVRQLLMLGAFLALSSLTRPEGLLVAGLVLADRLLRGRKHGWRNFLFIFFSFAGIYIPYFCWRFAYYGYLLPNTFYTKVGSNAEQISRGIIYFKDFLSPALLLVAIAMIPFATLRWFRTNRKLSLIPLILFFYTTYIILVGGDIMPAFRFFTPLLPLLCLLAGIALSSLPGPRRLAAVAGFVLSLAVVAYNLYEIKHDWFIRNKIEIDQTAARGREVGIWLRIHSRPGAVIATNTAGSIPYFSRMKTIDMLGLNDLHIAHRPIADLGKGSPGHEKGDGVYVLSRRPDYIHLGSSLGSIRPDHGFLSDDEIFAQPLFHQLYELKIIPLPSGRILNIFQKKRKLL
jgi:arabinofuranosyltransferase